MMAMRYGAVPIVRRTGGLADTVEDGRTGLVFETIDASACKHALVRAFNLFGDTARYADVQKTCMKTDYSWDRAQKAYAHLYENLVKAKTGQ